MDYYLEIQLLPDPEFKQGMLMNALFSKLHRALAEQQQDALGVSFPGHENASGLGAVLRVHGNEANLNALAQTDWLKGMRDHMQSKPAAPVPASVQHRIVRRVQAKSSPERLRRRAIKRHDLSEAEANKRIPDGIAQQLKLPYVSVKSQSTQQQFRLFIEHSPLLDKSATGSFTTYGLSTQATIPWF